MFVIKAIEIDVTRGLDLIAEDFVYSCHMRSAYSYWHSQDAAIILLTSLPPPSLLAKQRSVE